MNNDFLDEIKMKTSLVRCLPFYTTKVIGNIFFSGPLVLKVIAHEYPVFKTFQYMLIDYLFKSTFGLWLRYVT